MLYSHEQQLLEDLPTRLTKDLKRYFQSFTLAGRKRMKTVIVDLNAAYVSFIPQIFLNAKIIIDHFHIVQMANLSVNVIRTKLMKTFDQKSKNTTS